MTIDVWMQHPPTRRFLASDFLASLRRWTGGRIPPEGDLPIEVTVSAMDAAGVGVGLLSAWRGPPRCGPGVQRRSGRMGSPAPVEVRRAGRGGSRPPPMDAVRELRRRVRDDGFVGLRVVPWLWGGAPPNRPSVLPLFAECVELGGVPFCTQVGHTGPLRPSETGRPIPYIDEIALDFPPKLTIVCGHVGYPWTEEMVAVSRKHENVYIDTSAYTSRRLPKELVSFMKTGTGARKVLFGTNYPMIGHTHALDGLDELGLSESTHSAYLHDNATRVFAKLGAVAA